MHCKLARPKSVKLLYAFVDISQHVSRAPGPAKLICTLTVLLVCAIAGSHKLVIGQPIIAKVLHAHLPWANDGFNLEPVWVTLCNTLQT